MRKIHQYLNNLKNNIAYKISPELENTLGLCSLYSILPTSLITLPYYKPEFITIGRTIFGEPVVRAAINENWILTGLPIILEGILGLSLMIHASCRYEEKNHVEHR